MITVDPTIMIRLMTYRRHLFMPFVLSGQNQKGSYQGCKKDEVKGFSKKIGLVLFVSLMNCE